MGGLAKYLPEYNWHPVIVTAKLPRPSCQNVEVVETEYPGDASALFLKKLRFNPDNSFEAQSGIQRVAEDGTIIPLYRLLYAVKSWIAYPDNQKHWYGYALEAAEDLIEKRHFDAIISSSQPITSHLIARELKNRHDIPWIADLRDLWSQGHGTIQGPFRRWCEKKLELRTLKDADALITVSSPLAEKLSTLHPAKRIYTVTNGFDPDDISEVPPAKEFTITYTGSLYHKQNPTILLQALDRLRGQVLSRDDRSGLLLRWEVSYA
jgi:glycosyltransferase involved in cell wall biosynthesis